MNKSTEQNNMTYDAIVIGVGHAGIEAGLALARLNKRTLMTSISLDNIGYLACNPSIGGTAKGHLVREIDALGGQMGITADKTLTQLRMLNSSKGPAVHSLRGQVDKNKYHFHMVEVLENEPNIDLLQAEVEEIIIDNGKVYGILTTLKDIYNAQVVILACGVYLDSTIIIGDSQENKGPASFARANYLADNLKKHGVEMRRFKTGTPARVHRASIDLDKLEPQGGEDVPYTFSSMSKKVSFNKELCYLGYTNSTTHDIIRDNLHLSPKYNGSIHGVGARYCPSIEDKIVRFADKDRHQFFLEPESAFTQEMYVQGISTSLPSSVQKQIYSSIVGFKNVKIMRNAYAIEYECIDPMQLYPTLALKNIEGMYFAGQINGTSGYEEAAAQGLVAGINASRYIDNSSPLVLSRENSYIGVLIDDLVTQGTNEPYRMMTSRAEYRLHLRQDNADIRLTQIGRDFGLVTNARYKKYLDLVNQIGIATSRLGQVYTRKQTSALFIEAEGNEIVDTLTLKEIIKRNSITHELLAKHLDVFNDISLSAVEQVFISIKYEGYLQRQYRAMQEQQRVTNTMLSCDIDYASIKELRIEAREKLAKIKPINIGQASRISGVTPADVNVLILYLAKWKLKAD